MWATSFCTACSVSATKQETVVATALVFSGFEFVYTYQIYLTLYLRLVAMLRRRRIGRWLSDATVLLPLLTSRQCHFHLQTAPWALTWTPSLTLRFTNSTHQTQQSLSTDPDLLNTNLQPVRHDLSAKADVASQLPDTDVLSPGDAMPAKLSETKLHIKNAALHSQATFQQQSVNNDEAADAYRASQHATHVSERHSSAAPAHKAVTGCRQEPLAQSIRQQEQLEAADQAVGVSLAKPHSIVPLFDGGSFDGRYNSKYKPVEFVTPVEMRKAVLEAVITGTAWPPLTPSVPPFHN